MSLLQRENHNHTLLFFRVALIALHICLPFFRFCFGDGLLRVFVRLQGNTTVTGRESPRSLYSSDLASMEIEGGGSIDYEPADAQASIVVPSKDVG